MVDATGGDAKGSAMKVVWHALAREYRFASLRSDRHQGPSATRRRDVCRLIRWPEKTHSWSVAPLAMDRVFSSYFTDETKFPAGTIAFDCALVMRNIAHEWQAGAPMYI